MAELDPATVDTISASVDLTRFKASAFDRVYDLETPASTDFSFTVAARGQANEGTTRLEIGHVANNGVVPALGVETMAGAGLRFEGAGMSNEGNLLNVTGDGFSRVTIRGQITTDQVMLVRVPRAKDTLDIGIRLRIGAASAINLPNVVAPSTRPGMTSTTIYSSKSWHFGLPAIAVSGDRYSVVTYDGKPDTTAYVDRNRRWLQMDAITGAVTGGEAVSGSKDNGNWRDQEIAALGNVLAVVYTGNREVRADVSLDRGATFPIQKVLQAGVKSGLRLVQMAIGSDYKLGCIFWGNGPGANGARLMLIEGTPTAFDINNNPLDYTFGAAEILHVVGGDCTPLLMHAEYSVGGDMVIGYGYTQWDSNQWKARFRCAVRLWGQAAFSDQLVDGVTRTFPSDPHVAVLGSGASMEIFYAWDKADGVHLRYSSNAGQTFVDAYSVSTPGAFMPSVHARMVGAEKRIDLLYLSPTPWGLELHNARWTDFTPTTAPGTYAVVTASTAAGGAAPDASLPAGQKLTMVAWFGYDAVVKIDKVAVVVHEVTVDSYEYYTQRGLILCMQASAGGGAGGGWGGSGGGGYSPPPPPKILLPGMTNTVPAPDPTHRSQLKIITLD